jgi:predicted CXXCH cytochrome family protein
MNRESQILCVFTFVLALILMSGWNAFASAAASKRPAAVTATKPAPAAETAPKAAGSSKTTCLACHGPYEKIMAKTADYRMRSGDQEIQSNPHRYVPHESKDVQDIPECSYCHEPHPVPLATKQGLPKPMATWCYGCHHAKVLTCGTCH